MSLKKNPDGSRYVQVEAEVKGTPEEVWAAIATGPGISSWFMPTQIEGKVGGKVVTDFGPGMEDPAEVKSWQPPERFAAESFPFGPEGPPVATEWIVQPKEGGSCIVRVVHSLFEETDEWDNQLEGFESGWPWFFRILALYLERFPGQPSGLARVSAFTTLPEEGAWKAFTEALALAPEEGTSWTSPDGSLELALERIEVTDGYALLAETKQPAPGIASAFAHPMGEKTLLSASLFFYGEVGRQKAPEVEAKLQSWLAERFSVTP